MTLDAPLPGLRGLRADNPGPFTLDGTRTWIVGRDRPAVVDPGPDLEAHLQALAGVLDGASAVRLVLTHGHADHAGGVDALTERLRGTGTDVTVVGPGDPGGPGGPGAPAPVETDAGRLRPVHTPGHTPDHLAWLWEEPRALFVGDLLLGEGDTTWVADYPGCVADYLASLERVRALEPALLIPTHGPVLDDPGAALDRFGIHRRERIEQVRRAMEEGAGGDVEAVLDRVYGDTVPPGLRSAARASVEALMEHVRSRPD